MNGSTTSSSPNDERFELCPMHFDDIPEGLRLCRAAGWNQIARDWQILLNHSPSDCFVGRIDQQVVGTVAATRYGNRLAWIGMVLVDPAHRRKGLGTLLLRHIISHVGDDTPMALDATPAGREVYLKLGFVDVCSMVRLACDSPSSLTVTSLPTHVTPMAETDLDQVVDYDTHVFGTSRDLLLRWWFHGASQYAWLDSLNGNCQGYCLGRIGHTYHQLGPIIAENLAACQQLAGAAFASAPDNHWIIDVPTVHTEWVNWLKKRGFREQRPLIRMVRSGSLPNRDLTKQFAVIAPELG